MHRVFFFQDTNTVNFYTMPCVAALSLKNDAHMISTCVKRRPHEQVRTNSIRTSHRRADCVC